jgi:hypothetical protein
VKLSLRIRPDWLTNGSTIEFDLPRHLVCARCDGGGCDVCGGSGAITVRGREEPIEIVRVTLPMRGELDAAPESGLASSGPTSVGRGVAIRIPEYGGLADDPALGRGFLILSLLLAETPDPTVRLMEPTDPGLTLPRPPKVPTIPGAGGASRAPVWIAVGLVSLWVIFLALARLLGWG